MRISSEKGSEIFVFMPRISFGTFFFFSVTANREIKKNLFGFFQKFNNIDNFVKHLRQIKEDLISKFQKCHLFQIRSFGNQIVYLLSRYRY